MSSQLLAISSWSKAESQLVLRLAQLSPSLYYFIFICALGPNSPTHSLPSVKMFMTLSLNPRDALCISKIEQVLAIFVRQQKEKSC